MHVSVRFECVKLFARIFLPRACICVCMYVVHGFGEYILPQLFLYTVANFHAKHSLFLTSFSAIPIHSLCVSHLSLFVFC